MSPRAAREPAAARWLRYLAGLGRSWGLEPKAGAELGFRALDQVWMHQGRPRFLFQIFTGPDVTLEGALLTEALATARYGYWEVIAGDTLCKFVESGEVAGPGPPARSLTRAEVVFSAPACRGHHRLVVRCPSVARIAQPGQFLHISCTTEAELDAFAASKNRPTGWSGADLATERTAKAPHWPLLRRPMSIHRIASETTPPAPAPSPVPGQFRRLMDHPCRTQVALLLKLVGLGARRLAQRQVAEWLDILGPLGTPVPIADDLERAIVIAGGIGIAPLAFLAEELALRNIETHLLVGARDRERLPIGVEPDAWERPLASEFRARGIAVDLVTEAEDGVTVAERFEQRRDELLAGGRVEIFACGPRPMLARVCCWRSAWRAEWAPAGRV
ncbi:hypothetical protein AMK68_03875 [candidate division KD3-62 bacterium DG_56]|uniref:FAD-binding FR-type domain-containing protein n=1 Tax=candidate division KD3-62 bacterium DG_56 TaxID=1704032 RepID=A0A0S7XMM8_9BACT|nr:MAG: hypothetical protein AMK68_03875 [candidate division KD3-62 bacterium DG_56]